MPSTQASQPVQPPYYDETPPQWLFKESDMELTPSRIEGMSAQEEVSNRRKGINFITQVGISLKLDQITLATASIYLQRFYMRHPLQIGGKGAHHYQIAATAVYVAYKTKENPRKMHELIIAVSRVAQKDPNLMIDEQSKEFWKWRETIQHHENLMLEVLCFDLDIGLPYHPLYEFLKLYQIQENKRLRNIAWAVVNDSFTTILCLLVQPQSVAGGALYIGLNHAKIKLDDDEYGRSWWEQLGLDVEEMAVVIEMMLQTYENPSVPRNAQESGVYARDPDGIDFDRTRHAVSGNDRTIEEEERDLSEHEERSEEQINGFQEQQMLDVQQANGRDGSEEGELG